ncbi:MAG: cell division protein SepF [Clostridiales bacterium]|nr:cell division protein SepF [Clostridiales bacterium]
MSGFLDKVGNFFFKDVDGPVEEKPMAEGARALNVPQPEHNVWQDRDERRKRSNLISVPGRGGAKGQDFMEMVLIKATSYDDMQDIANHIKSRKVAVVNFEDMDKEVAQRMVDFLSGATFALDGVPRKVSGGTFIFSSANVDLSGQIMDRDGSFTDFSRDERFTSTSWLRK